MTAFRSKRVLVTGADGFIGSHLSEALVREGAQVRAFCIYNSQGSYGWLDEAPPDVLDSIDARLGDVRDARFVEQACEGIDIVFHLAALIAIPYNYQAPQSFVDTNVTGTLNVLEAVRRNGCERLVHTSTSEVYGTPESIPIRETHPLQGQSPYSASKIAADKLCEAYHRSFDVPVVTIRPFNTFGPRQSTRAVLPTILVQLLSGSREVRLGRIDPRRDLTFVSDTVNGLLRGGDRAGIEGETIQLGTGSALSVAELFELARRATGSDAVIIEDRSRYRPDNSEVMTLISDPQKALALLNWAPAISLADGIGATAEWLRHRAAPGDPARYHV